MDEGVCANIPAYTYVNWFLILQFLFSVLHFQYVIAVSGCVECTS